jgi:hypothetical protein
VREGGRGNCRDKAGECKEILQRGGFEVGIMGELPKAAQRSQVTRFRRHERKADLANAGAALTWSELQGNCLRRERGTRNRSSHGQRLSPQLAPHHTTAIPTLHSIRM